MQKKTTQTQTPNQASKVQKTKVKFNETPEASKGQVPNLSIALALTKRELTEDTLQLSDHRFGVALGSDDKIWSSWSSEWGPEAVDNPADSADFEPTYDDAFFNAGKQKWKKDIYREVIENRTQMMLHYII